MFSAPTIRLERQTVLTTGARGTWYFEVTDCSSHGVPHVVCPSCKLIQSLRNHVVDERGCVTEASRCRCGFTAFFELIGYPEARREGLIGFRTKRGDLYEVVVPEDFVPTCALAARGV